MPNKPRVIVRRVLNVSRVNLVIAGTDGGVPNLERARFDESETLPIVPNDAIEVTDENLIQPLGEIDSNGLPPEIDSPAPEVIVQVVEEGQTIGDLNLTISTEKAAAFIKGGGRHLAETMPDVTDLQSTTVCGFVFTDRQLLNKPIVEVITDEQLVQRLTELGYQIVSDLPPAVSQVKVSPNRRLIIVERIKILYDLQFSTESE